LELVWLTEDERAEGTRGFLTGGAGREVEVEEEVAAGPAALTLRYLRIVGVIGEVKLWNI